jgi:hypothetical protein
MGGPCTKNHANHGNHVHPVKLTFGHRHKQLFLQDYRIRRIYMMVATY